MTSDAKTLPSLLLVDDDIDFCSVMARALTRRGYDVRLAHNVVQAIEMAGNDPPEYAVIDLNMPGESGLALIPQLKALDTNTQIVVLTGYASVATAVEAIKLGAIHYISKPADVNDIITAFDRKTGDTQVPVGERPPTIERLEWEHIQKVLRENDGNISETARQLRMHRRTLQRKLTKRPARE